ncbi:4'-phosphopantetheinyl transferase family protein [Salinibacter altiplanensis]|uniref:4'-phosphopantetheinyl transferase family protein n=1 Tax=Salinibacter altiplanensis TaxID=1803181 RepID=UPI000C9F9607|nr:4'-phosphopantetheinyl transferase superfamily protein [Salinibacter altiplanensis]
MELPVPAWSSSWPEQPQVGVWRLRLDVLDGNPAEVLRPLTVSSEHERARRYRFAADRHRHLAGRALVRLVASRRYDCAPDALSVTNGPHGKPKLQPPPGDRPPLHVNIGHTGKVVIVAVSQTQPVGIDVEPRARSVEAAALAERVLTAAERTQWRARAAPAPDRQDAFLHIWTCKEAFLKATGEGLHRAPQTVECTFDGPTVASLRDAPDHRASPSSPCANQWSVQPFSATDAVVGALVRKDRMPSSVAWVDATEIVTRRVG